MNFQPRASHLVSASREVTLESQLYDLIRLLQGYWTTGFGPYLYPKDENFWSGSTLRNKALGIRNAPLFARYCLD